MVAGGIEDQVVWDRSDVFSVVSRFLSICASSYK